MLNIGCCSGSAWNTRSSSAPYPDAAGGRRQRPAFKNAVNAFKTVGTPGAGFAALQLVEAGVPVP
jgi:hypothetical protein